MAYSAPWYEALEKGAVEANDVWRGTEATTGSADDLVICQSMWKIIETHGARDFTCRYVIRDRLSSSVWRVRFDRNLNTGIPEWDEMWTLTRVPQ